MPRDLPIGNGRLLVNFNADYVLMDIYFPHVGLENHTEGHACRFGVWTGGRFAWMGKDWQRSLRYRPESLVTDVVATHPGLGLTLRCRDAVDFHEDIYLKEVEVENLADHGREVRLFFHHDFHIYGIEVGDTASYEPRTQTVTHYKQRRYFLVGGCVGDRCGVDQWAIGTKEFQGAEGTWRDAEDGELGGNPISQGAVDSTVALHLTVPARGRQVAHYWIAVGKDWPTVRTLDKLILDRTPQALIKRTEDYWRLWVNKEVVDFADLPKPLVDLYKESLLIVRTQIDNEGAIVAANDADILRFGRDTYSYVWPRDGALVAYALDLAGYPEITGRFYEFCGRVITGDGYFFHKYHPDGSQGSSWHPWYKDGEAQLPIQEDETALVLWALWQHFDRYRDVEFVKPLYKPLVKTAADFLVAFRDVLTGLPKASWDLWEERRGVLTFTAGAVHGGLKAAERFTRAFGETGLADGYAAAAAEVRAGMDRHLWLPDRKRFARMLVPKKGGGYEVDATIDASLYGAFAFGAYPADDERIVQTMQAIKDRLWCKTSVGGIARYEDDYYHQVSHDIANVPGNPWFICTLWLAQHVIARAKTRTELDEALPLLEWVRSRALPSGVLAEQVNPETDEPLSVSPLTWSHATLIMAVNEYLAKRRELPG